MDLSDRSLGWLRYLDRKAHTPDDWSRGGHPHPHWDDRSDEPMASWHRFDLVDSSYAMGLMAHRTPAWTERYVAILDQLIERHTGWWSASDWLTQFGHDPDRADYPDVYRLWVPPELWGDYDVPGWTANGIEPYGVQMDPVLDVHHRLPVVAALTTAYYAAPQEPDDARRLFAAACTSAGLDDDPITPPRPNRAWPAAMILAREWGLTELDRRVAASIETTWEPAWDADRGEFTWGLGLGEEHPRGQFNAFLAAAEAAGPGAWERLSAAPLDPCPQVVDVDFPRVALRRAEWIDGTLHLDISALQPDPRERTTLRVVDVDPGREWTLRGQDGCSIHGRAGGLVVTAPVADGVLEIVPAAGGAERA